MLGNEKSLCPSRSKNCGGRVLLMSARAYLVGMRVLITAALLACLAVLPAKADDRLSLEVISGYLNELTSGQTDFVQFNEDGSRSRGVLYLKRPGRMRFEYEPPNSGVVIAGQGTVIIHDTKSNQPPETYPLRRTPLSLILAKRVDLDTANMVVDHLHDGTFTVVRAQDPKNPEYGFIDLKFESNPIALRQWIITNEPGIRTAVVLEDLQTGLSLDNALCQTETPRGGSNR